MSAMKKRPDISVSFIGQDYSPLEAAVKTAVSVPPLSEEQHRRILFLTLNQINNGKLTIGKATTRKESIPLYKTIPSGECYFDGVVGVVTTNLLISENEWHSMEDDPGEARTGPVHVQVKLQIQSRIDAANRKSQPYFLAAMLMHGKNIDLNDDMVPSDEEELFDYLLLFWFRDQFREAIRKGFYRQYRRFERNDDRLKGSIDFSRHIRLNMGQRNGKIAYNIRENTNNNYINHLIVAAYDVLKRKYPRLVEENFDSIRELKQSLEELRQMIGYSQCRSYDLIARNLRTISHPYYTEYEQLRKTCLKIMRNEQISIFETQGEENTKGILYYMPDLWEDFLETRFQLPRGITMRAQELVSIFGVGTEGAENPQTFRQSTYPDYIFYQQNNGENVPFMILDAKFKPGNDEQKTGWPYAENGRLDGVLEDYSKCIRDMVSINAHATGVIFPTKNIKQSHFCHKISRFNGVDHFYTFPISIPPVGEQSYRDWVKALDENVSQTMGSLKTCLEKEAQYAWKAAQAMQTLADLREE